MYGWLGHLCDQIWRRTNPFSTIQNIPCASLHGSVMRLLSYFISLCCFSVFNKYLRQSAYWIMPLNMTDSIHVSILYIYDAYCQKRGVTKKVIIGLWQFALPSSRFLPLFSSDSLHKIYSHIRMYRKPVKKKLNNSISFDSLFIFHILCARVLMSVRMRRIEL